ncbi:MAG: lipopolysaccharide heptosyltransferase II [Acidobacteria bacterium]|nr:lipopolysaccharide heptosyltransferase II [Acidobacteriota bacterium]
MALGKTLRPGDLARSSIMVRVPNWVGDAVMSLPALRALRAALPEARITLLARPWVRDVYPLDELRFRLIDYDTQSTHRGVRGRLAIAKLLRREQFDLALLFQNAFDATLVAWLGRIPLRAGYARDARRLLLTHPVEPPTRGETPAHEAHYYLELLKRLQLIAEYAEAKEIALRPASFVASGRARLLGKLGELGVNPSTLSSDVPLIGISPGASFGTAKRWPAERFATLARSLHEDLGAQCVLFGSSQEAPLADEVVSSSMAPVISLAGKTSLTEFMELVSGCDAYLTNDTGTMHVAAALGVPTIAIFGPTNEQETAPLGPRVEMVVGVAHCRPCKLRHCPIDHRCMTSITPDAVLERIRGVLQR